MSSIKIIFKNFEKSEMIESVITTRLESMQHKFPDLVHSNLSATLEMQNSPFQTGRDVYSVTIRVANGRYDGVKVKKSSESLYSALADIQEHLLEIFNRFSDKARVQNRERERNFAKRVRLNFENL